MSLPIVAMSSEVPDALPPLFNDPLEPYYPWKKIFHTLCASLMREEEIEKCVSFETWSEKKAKAIKKAGEKKRKEKLFLSRLVMRGTMVVYPEEDPPPQWTETFSWRGAGDEYLEEAEDKAAFAAFRHILAMYMGFKSAAGTILEEPDQGGEEEGETPPCSLEESWTGENSVFTPEEDGGCGSLTLNPSPPMKSVDSQTEPLPSFLRDEEAQTEDAACQTEEIDPSAVSYPASLGREEGLGEAETFLVGSQLSPCIAGVPSDFDLEARRELDTLEYLPNHYAALKEKNSKFGIKKEILSRPNAVDVTQCATLVNFSSIDGLENISSPLLSSTFKPLPPRCSALSPSLPSPAAPSPHRSAPLVSLEEKGDPRTHALISASSSEWGGEHWELGESSGRECEEVEVEEVDMVLPDEQNKDSEETEGDMDDKSQSEEEDEPRASGGKRKRDLSQSSNIWGKRTKSPETSSTSPSIEERNAEIQRKHPSKKSKDNTNHEGEREVGLKKERSVLSSPLFLEGYFSKKPSQEVEGGSEDEEEAEEVDPLREEGLENVVAYENMLCDKKSPDPAQTEIIQGREEGKRRGKVSDDGSRKRTDGRKIKKKTIDVEMVDLCEDSDPEVETIEAPNDPSPLHPPIEPPPSPHLLLPSIPQKFTFPWLSDESVGSPCSQPSAVKRKSKRKDASGTTAMALQPTEKPRKRRSSESLRVEGSERAPQNSPPLQVSKTHVFFSSSDSDKSLEERAQVDLTEEGGENGSDERRKRDSRRLERLKEKLHICQTRNRANGLADSRSIDGESVGFTPPVPEGEVRKVKSIEEWDGLVSRLLPPAKTCKKSGSMEDAWRDWTKYLVGIFGEESSRFLKVKYTYSGPAQMAQASVEIPWAPKQDMRGNPIWKDTWKLSLIQGKKCSCRANALKSLLPKAVRAMEENELFGIQKKLSLAPRESKQAEGKGKEKARGKQTELKQNMEADKKGKTADIQKSRPPRPKALPKDSKEWIQRYFSWKSWLISTFRIKMGGLQVNKEENLVSIHVPLAPPQDGKGEWTFREFSCKWRSNMSEAKVKVSRKAIRFLESLPFLDWAKLSALVRTDGRGQADKDPAQKELKQAENGPKDPVSALYTWWNRLWKGCCPSIIRRTFWNSKDEKSLDPDSARMDIPLPGDGPQHWYFETFEVKRVVHPIREVAAKALSQLKGREIRKLHGAPKRKRR